MTERVIQLIHLSLKEPLIQSFLKNKFIKKLHALAERFVCFCCNQAPENGMNKNNRYTYTWSFINSWSYKIFMMSRRRCRIFSPTLRAQLLCWMVTNNIQGQPSGRFQNRSVFALTGLAGSSRFRIGTITTLICSSRLVKGKSKGVSTAFDERRPPTLWLWDRN